MKARFFGGPYDGMELELADDVDKLNAMCDVVPVPGDKGLRQFLIMPSPQNWERIDRGEITEETRDSATVLHPYERQFVPGAVEYHLADAWFPAQPSRRAAVCSRRD
jgi:hypothetical protein